MTPAEIRAEFANIRKRYEGVCDAIAPIRVGQPEVSGIDPSQDGTEFDEQGAEFPVHVDRRCNVHATDDDFDDIDDGDCWQCGGEGFVANCQDEIGCVDPESGCDFCTRRCDVCKPTNT